ncbi:MAG: hypothetical protein LUG50_05055 [Planctomycetaceae bacterium]|nr:hypothetical protein [Planctomycetaceae bacterium]
MKHRILYRLLASLALFAVTVHSGMARSGEVTGKDIHVGIIMKSYDEFQNVVIEGAEAAAREIGASFIANAPTPKPAPPNRSK